MRDIERMHTTIFDIFLTEAKIYQMFSMAKCKKKCQINVAELISCPCRAILPCLLIKFYGLISLCKVVVAFKTLNEKDKLNTLHWGCWGRVQLITFTLHKLSLKKRKRQTSLPNK